jgi:hypothetical protein
LAAAGVTAGGAAYSANKQASAAKALNKSRDGGTLRNDINQIYSQILSGWQKGKGLGFNSPLATQIASRYQNILSPDRQRSGRILAQSPEQVLGRLGDVRRPVFEYNLSNTLGDLTASYGAQAGLRPGASTDLDRAATSAVGRAENQFEADLLGLYPSLADVVYRAQLGQQNIDLASLAGAQNFNTNQLTGLLPLASGHIGQYATNYAPPASATGAFLSSAADAGLSAYYMSQLLKPKPSTPPKVV